MQKYKLTVVGAHEAADQIEGADMNDAGQVVGRVLGTTDSAAFRYDPHDGFQTIADMKFARSMNAAGAVAGSNGGSYDHHPCVYTPGDAGAKSVWTPFGDAGYSVAVLEQICDNGDLVGLAGMPPGPLNHAFVMDKDHVILDLWTTVKEQLFLAKAQNKDGLVVGLNWLKSEGQQQGFSYDRASNTVQIYEPKFVPQPEDWKVTYWTPDLYTVAVNGLGEILARDSHTGWLVCKGGSQTLLPSPGEWTDGEEVTTLPAALNDKGLVLSESAKVFDREAPYIGWLDLNASLASPSSWTIEEGIAIKNDGRILCNGSSNGKVRPLILTPTVVIEPKDTGAPDISRLKAFARILFGILGDGDGIELVGSGWRPRHVGPGPDDPNGPRREIFFDLTPGQRDTLLALALGEMGSLFSSPAHGREALHLAEKIMISAAGRLAPARSASRGGPAYMSLRASRRESQRALLARMRAEAPAARRR